MGQFRLLLRPVAVTLIAQSLFMALCGFFALYWGEIKSFKAFGLTVLFVLAAAGVLWYFSVSRASANLSLKGGFLFVSFVWIAVTVAGAVPYVFSSSIPNFADAYFETVSGFATSGSTILSDVEVLPKSVLLWRALTHWLGGGGIIVLSVAILPLLGVGGAQIMKAETTGVVQEKLTPRMAQTAKYLWLFYVFLTIVLTGLLIYGDMSVFDAVCHSFSTISTGGLSSKNASVGAFDSLYIDVVITVFMLISSVNFLLLIKVARGNILSLFRDSEFKAFILIFIVATGFVTFFLYLHTYDNWGDALRYGAFQVAAVLSTTGFATADYEKWFPAAQAVIFVLFFIGGCSGSTSGGMKVIRHVVLLKQLFIEMKYLLHPNVVYTMRLNSAPVERKIIFSVMGFFFIYMLTVLIGAFLVATSGADILTSLTASLASLGTFGPGFGAVGPTKNFGFFPDYVKYILSALMIIGRLEFYTFLIIFTPWFWKK